MGAAEKLEKKRFTVEEYLEFEKNSDARYEFYQGDVFAMAGTTRNHNRIAKKISRLLDDAFESKGCETVLESIKLEAIINHYYPYPDVMLLCDPNDNDEYIARRPSLIVEVLSQSTMDYDRTFKFRRYRAVPTLLYYVMVSQYEPFVEVYEKQEHSQQWLYSAYEKMEDLIHFERLGFQLSLVDVYQNIVFSKKND